MNTLNQYGLSERFTAEASLYPDLRIGRIVSQHKDLYRVVTEDEELLAEVSGKYRFEAKHLSDFPAVGDFVMLDKESPGKGNAVIRRLLSRKSLFERKAVGAQNETQVIAANIDTVFICMSLNNNFNLRRLERYLSIAWDSRAKPVVVLTKADLCENIKQRLEEISTVAAGADIVVTSCFDPFSYEKVRAYLGEGRTASFIGSSGVGKSTLINCLAGKELLNTAETRGDDRGRHTTTSRELILLPLGGVVIDTPGMRELGVESADLGRAFSDIDELAAKCRFKDCSHKSEPGCAVRAAVESGQLDAPRLENFLKLKKEAKYDGLNSRQIETKKINEMFAGVGGIKNARKFAKEKNRQKSL